MNFLKKILKNFKIPRLVMKGSCKMCGNCCKNIAFMIGSRYVTEEEEFEQLKQFDRGYNNFFIAGKGSDNELLFACKSLGDDNLCKDYKLRSLYCRLYPKIKLNGLKNRYEMSKNCGYYIESNIKFEEFMK